MFDGINRFAGDKNLPHLQNEFNSAHYFPAVFCLNLQAALQANTFFEILPHDNKSHVFLQGANWIFT